MRAPKSLSKFALTSEMESLKDVAKLAMKKGEAEYNAAASAFNTLVISTFDKDSEAITLVSYSELSSFLK